MQNCLGVRFWKQLEEPNKYALNFFQPLGKLIDLPINFLKIIGDALMKVFFMMKSSKVNLALSVNKNLQTLILELTWNQNSVSEVIPNKPETCPNFGLLFRTKVIISQ